MMHVVLGDGTMPSKELKAHLDSMAARAEADGESFWFLIQSKSEPTSTDTALLHWLTENDVHFETISDDKEPSSEYALSKEHYTAKRLAPKVLEVIEMVKTDYEEDSRLLGLFVSDDPTAEEDRWLNDIVFAVAEAGYGVFALNDGMAPVDLEDADEVEAEVVEPDEPVEAPAPAPALTIVPDLPKPAYTREELEGMDLTEVKHLAAEAGITLPPRTRFPTYVKALLGEEGDAAPAEAEVTEPEPVLDHNDEPVGEDGWSETPTLTNGFATAGTTGPAMLIVVHNGMVTSRIVTPAQAAALLTSTL